jgi:hypothetical protein
MNLPPGVYLKHGAYYIVRSNEWIRLTRDPNDIERALAAAKLRVPASKQEIMAYAERLLPRSRANAKGRRNLEHTLTRDDLVTMLNDSGWRCAVTKTPFSLAEVGDRRQRPYAPSIDRVDCARGYHADNCRMVCVIVNFAMNTWGEEALRHVAKHMTRPRISDSQIGQAG